MRFRRWDTYTGLCGSAYARNRQRGGWGADCQVRRRGQDYRRGRARRHRLRHRRGFGGGEHRRGRQGPDPRHPRPGRRLRRDEPDRPRPALGDGARRHRRRVLRRQLRGLRGIGEGRAGAGGRADPHSRPPPAPDQRAHGANRPRHRPPHPAVAERDPRGDRRSGRPLRPRGGEPAARAAHAPPDRALPDRARRGRQGRGGALLDAAPEHRGVPGPVVRQGRGHRPRDLEPLRRRRRAGVARKLRPLGAQPRPPAPAGRPRRHARPVPPQHVPRERRDVRLRRALPRPRQARAPGRDRRPPQAGRARLPVPRAHPLRGARRPAAVHGRMGPGDGRDRARRPPERLPRDLPPAPRRHHALRALPPTATPSCTGRAPRPSRRSSRTTPSASTCRWSASRTGPSSSPGRSSGAR